MENEIALQEIKTPTNITASDIKQYICPLATDKEVFMFLNICKMYELNPFKRGEIYLVKYNQNAPATTLVGYETYLKRAETSKNWDGMEAITEGKPEDGSLKAVVKIFRKDWNHPFTHEVYFDEYVQKKIDGTVNKFWKEKPRTMLKKVALSQAFRLCFPSEFGGLPYTKEEYNDIEMTEEPKSAKPVLEMPKSIKEVVVTNNDVKMQPEPILQSKPAIVEATKKPENEVSPRIAKSEWERLLKVALSNGWQQTDVIEWVKSIGYKSSASHTLLTAEDAEDFEYTFSQSKEAREAIKAEALKK